MSRTFKDQRRYQAKQMMPYCVARMTDSGKWQPIEWFSDYDAADERVDYWAERYSNTLVDIVDREDLQHIWAVSAA